MARSVCLAFSFDWYSSKSAEDLPHHYAHRVFAQILRDTDEPDARFAQAA
jgi:hypothetical protein